MNLKCFITILFICLFITEAHTSNCIFSPITFCQTIDEESIVARVRTMPDMPPYEVLILETLSDHQLPDTIRFEEGNGGVGTITPYFFLGVDYLVNITNHGSEDDPYYAIHICGTRSIYILNDSLGSDLDPCIQSISYEDFLDDFYACQQTELFNVNGQVSNWNQDNPNPSEFEFVLSGMDIQTDLNGQFDCIQYDKSTYNGFTLTLTPSKESPITDHVSVLDLIRIRKAILNIQPFEYGEQYIAADVDGSQSVNVLDLLLLQKIILGIEDEFPNGVPNWRFFNVPIGGISINYPWNGFPQEFQTDNLYPYTYDLSFIAIKTGDVTGDF